MRPVTGDIALQELRSYLHSEPLLWRQKVFRYLQICQEHLGEEVLEEILIPYVIGQGYLESVKLTLEELRHYLNTH